VGARGHGFDRRDEREGFVEDGGGEILSGRRGHQHEGQRDATPSVPGALPMIGAMA
jgi:hypothetical protein